MNGFPEKELKRFSSRECDRGRLRAAHSHCSAALPKSLARKQRASSLRLRTCRGDPCSVQAAGEIGFRNCSSRAPRGNGTVLTKERVYALVFFPCTVSQGITQRIIEVRDLVNLVYGLIDIVFDA